MIWFVYALAAALFASAAALLEKKTLQDVHSFDFSVLLAIGAALCSLPIALTTDWNAISLPLLVGIFGVSLIVAIGHHSITKGLRHLEVSTASPMLLLSPLITTLLAFLILGERVSQIHFVGMALMILGLYILEVHSLMDWREFVRSITGSEHTRHMLVGVVLYGCSALVDRVMLSTYQVQAGLYVAIVQIFLAVIFLTWALIRTNAFDSLKLTAAKHWKIIMLIALITTIFRTLQSLAIALASVGVVIAVKRSSALFTTIIGGELFHDSDLPRKSLACVVMVGGVCLLALG